VIDLTISTRIFSIAFLVAAMLSVGLEVSGRQILASLRDARWMGRALLANLVLMPAFCLVLVSLAPLRHDLEAGLLLMAAAPGAPFSIQFTSKAKGAVPLAAALLLLFCAIALVLTPVLGGLLLLQGTSLDLPASRLAWRFALYLLAPLLVGLAVRRWEPDKAAVLSKPVSALAGLCFPFLLVLTLGLRSVRVLELGPLEVAGELGAMVALVVGGMAIGWLLGGPERSARRVLALGTGMRNTMVALLVAFASFPDTDIDLTVLATSAVGLALATALTFYETLRARARPRAGHEQTPGPPTGPRPGR
jgi:BASS family bile acid:Na+ symporter